MKDPPGDLSSRKAIESSRGTPIANGIDDDQMLRFSDEAQKIQPLYAPVHDFYRRVEGIGLFQCSNGVNADPIIREKGITDAKNKDRTLLIHHSVRSLPVPKGSVDPVLRTGEAAEGAPFGI